MQDIELIVRLALFADDLLRALAALARRWRNKKTSAPPPSCHRWTVVVLQARPDSTTLRQRSRCRERHNCGSMHIHLSDPSLVDDLLAFLRTRQCVAVVDPAGKIAVSIPDSTREDAARLELGLYLQVWLGTHPDVDVVLLP